MFNLIGYIVCGILAIYVILKQTYRSRVRYLGEDMSLPGIWYIFPFYQIAYMTAFAENNSVCSMTIAMLFVLMGLQMKPFKTFLRGYNIWYLLLIIWYALNLLRSNSVYYGIMQIMKLMYPVVIFVFAYHSYNTKNRILYLAESFSRSSWLFLFLSVLSAAIGMRIIYPYFGMEIFIYPFLLFLMFRKKKYIIHMLLCLSFCLVYIKRTCFLGLFTMAVVYLLYRYRLKALIPLVSLVVVAICAVLFIPAVSERLFYASFDFSYLDISLFTSGEVFQYIDTSGRSGTWAKLIEQLFIGNEVIGIGPGSLKAWMSSSITNDNFENFQRVHNDWLQIMIEGGYVAISLIAMMFIRLFIKTYRIYRNTRYSDLLRTFALGTAMISAATIVHMYFENCMGCVGFCLPWLFSAILFRAIELENRRLGRNAIEESNIN